MIRKSQLLALDALAELVLNVVRTGPKPSLLRDHFMPNYGESGDTDVNWDTAKVAQGQKIPLPSSLDRCHSLDPSSRLQSQSIRHACLTRTSTAASLASAAQRLAGPNKPNPSFLPSALMRPPLSLNLAMASRRVHCQGTSNGGVDQ